MKKNCFLTTLFFLIVFISNNSYANKQVTVGLYDNRPLCFTIDGSINGIYIDILKHVANEENWEITYIVKKWDECLTLLKEKKIDLLCGIAYTDERAKLFDFNKENVFVDWGQIFLPVDSKIQSIIDLNGKRVATVGGAILIESFKSLMQSFGLNCEFVEVTESLNVFEMVQENKVEAGTALRLFGLMFAHEYAIKPSPIVFAPLHLRFAAPLENDKSILNALDTHLYELKKNESSIYYRSLDKWIEAPSSKYHIPSWFFYAIAGVILMILFLMFSSMILKHKVKTKTAELNIRNEELEEQIFERVQAENALKESEARFRQVIENSSIAMAISDENQIIKYVNSAFIKTFGYTIEDIPTVYDWWVLAHQYENSTTFHQSIDYKSKRLITISEPNQGVVKCKNETTRWVEVSGGLIGKSNLLIFKDITDQKLAEEEKHKLEIQLRQSQKMEAIGTMAGGIAHDFNNILGIILGYTELALEYANKDPNVVDCLSESKIACLRAKEIIKQVAIFSRNSEPHKEAINITFVVRDSLHLIRASIPSTVNIRTNTYDIEGVVYANTTQINQILLNLCSNAVHAMNYNGTLTIELEEIYVGIGNQEFHQNLNIGDYAKLSVTDTGSGIDPAIRDRIFEPYFTTKEVGKGSGIGLAIVYGIIKAHNGAITVLSEVNKGSTFNVYLPICKNASDHENQQTNEIIQNGNERILIVDDEKMLLQMTETILKQLGYSVIAMNDPLDALKLFKSLFDKIDLVFTDMTMPNLPGNKLSTELLKIRQDIPIILCTGYTESIDENEIRKIGIKKFLPKPLSKKTIAKAIREVLDK